MKEEKFDFGLVGLGVMGRNFILNVAENGFSTLGLSSSEEKISLLRKEGKENKIDATNSDENFIRRLELPRKIMLLVPAGKPVDSMIERFLPFLNEGDLIIDGGNSHFLDTNRRYDFLLKKGIRFIGSGVSGGSMGARYGPSIMPGGDIESYELIKPIFESVSAKINNEPCVTYLGPKSSGHYVKMIHNGIEYALMQLISEVYHILKVGLNYNNDAIFKSFNKWNEGRLSSYLLEITRNIFNTKHKENNKYIIDLILDKAKQKGSGKWTSQNAMDIGINVPTIDSAISMRIISSFKELRENTYNLYINNKKGKVDILEDDLEKTLYFGFIISYIQGFLQLKMASKEYNYNLDFESVCRIWRGGCIIRADMLEIFIDILKENPNFDHLIQNNYILKIISECESSVRKVCKNAINSSIPIMGISSTLSYFDSFKTNKLPTNLIQAQRDYFGEHTYERVDKKGFFHTKWE